MKNIKSIIIVSIIIFSIALRFIGIDWGVPLSRTHFPYHPDEQMSMSILNQINLKTGDYIPEEAHVEGSFNYYLWKAYLLVISKIGILKFPTNQITFTDSNNDYGQALLASRILTTLFSSASMILMFLILNEFNIPYIPKTITLLLYGTNLIEVVHGHFMRPHTLGNFLLLLVIFLTHKTKKYKIIKKDVFSFVLYPLSGGFENKQLLSNILIPIAKIFEKVFIPFKYFFAFRCIIVLEKK